MLKDILERRYFVGEYNNIKVFASDHFLQQEQKRTDLKPEAFEYIIKKITEEIDNNRDMYDNEEMLFYSKKYQQGFILHWIPEKNRINLITFLPRKKSTSRDGTKKIIVENYDNLLENYFEDIKPYLWIDKDIDTPKRGINCDFAVDVTFID